MKLDYIAIGKRVRDERKKRQWSQADLAQITELSTSHISCIERGQSAFTVGHLVNLSQALHVPMEYILTGEIREMGACMKILEDAVGDCSPFELYLIADMIYTFKNSLRKCRA